jgi:D-alanyl-D-alanine carboxypeptidase
VPARRNTTARVIGSIAAVALLSAGCSGSPTTTAPPPAVASASAAADVPAFAATLQPLLEAKRAELRVPGAIVLVDVPGQRTWLHTMGTGDLATHTPISAENHVRIGSITKTMTATVVLQLVEEGKLALDDPVTKYEPQVPNGANITVRQLLNMTSGLFNLVEDDAFSQALDAQPEKIWTTKELLAIAFAHLPYFPPGQGWHYSNTNYVLLGDIAEQHGGAPLAELMNKRIFDRLGMHDTLLPSRDSNAIPEPHQRGYMYGTNVITNEVSKAGNKAAAQLNVGPDVKPVDATDWNPSFTHASGAVISTVHDLQIYAKALGSGELLSPATQHERSQFVPAGYGYGYGLGMMKVFGGLLGHTGAIPGFQSFVGYQPDKRVTVVVLANLYLAPNTYVGDGAPADEMAKVIAQQLLPS